MTGIDPKWAFWLGVVIFLEQGVGQGTVKLTNVIPDGWIPYVVSWCALLAWAGGAIQTALIGYSSKDKGPLTSVAKAAITVAVLAGSLFAFSGDARAQTRPKLTGNIAADIANATAKPGVALTGNIQQDLQALWQKIVTSSLADLNYAAAMAASANTTTSAIRLQCVKAIIQLNEQASGVNLKNADGTPMVKPDPHLFTDVESLAEIIDNLSPQGPLFVSCAGAAQLAKTNVLAFVNGVVTGVAGFAAMPVIPGL